MDPICPTCGGPLYLLKRSDGASVEVCPDCWFEIVYKFNTGELVPAERMAALERVAEAARRIEHSRVILHGDESVRAISRALHDPPDDMPWGDERCHLCNLRAALAALTTVPAESEA